ncbi:MAG: hypothetical protein HQL37_10025 [Alphaproteobacteria bacterium]|nr:hypothetical protein [Alphaproteobacteria bacterium]
MDFIFMLTRDDRTIEDCREVLALIAPLGLRHIGFKDIGIDKSTLAALTHDIRGLGALAYMEVVSTTSADARASIATAAEIGVDRVLGGQETAFALEHLPGGGAQYFPFAGRPEGHPTRLGGTPAAVAADCRRMRALGCAGVDLLAYRATEANPLDLVRAARAALTDGTLIVAGGIHSPEQIHALATAGADAFTIGSAIFDGSFSPRKGALISRVKDILDVCR